MNLREKREMFRLKRVTDFASELAQPMYLAMAVFGLSACFVVVALVRRMSELATAWRLVGSWSLGVSHAIGCLVMLAILFAGFRAAWRKGRA